MYNKLFRAFTLKKILRIKNIVCFKFLKNALVQSSPKCQALISSMLLLIAKINGGKFGKI